MLDLCMEQMCVAHFGRINSHSSLYTVYVINRAIILRPSQAQFVTLPELQRL
jgi:hypothetical protein